MCKNCAEHRIKRPPSAEAEPAHPASSGSFSETSERESSSQRRIEAYAGVLSKLISMSSVRWFCAEKARAVNWDDIKYKKLMTFTAGSLDLCKSRTSKKRPEKHKPLRPAFLKYETEAAGTADFMPMHGFRMAWVFTFDILYSSLTSVYVPPGEKHFLELLDRWKYGCDAPMDCRKYNAEFVETFQWIWQDRFHKSLDGARRVEEAIIRECKQKKSRCIVL